MVSDNENADRIFFFFFQLKNSIQTYNYVFLWNFGVLGVHLPYSLHFAEKAKHISESRLIELFNWSANSTAQQSRANQYIYEHFFRFNILRNQEQHIMHIDQAHSLSHPDNDYGTEKK